ncbi:hypothetical protein HNP65_000323 [Thermosipho japonicus]|uniref:Uncharacterized protein n=1 Tax=Thermosipho japonicus TaxID=90323 RepID=A0A841GTS4_9BACT|nr:hypothetical protein [Thermosipho japonicus]MBB6061901.1 hypothetical protein [Thermosipho japonicus]
MKITNRENLYKTIDMYMEESIHGKKIHKLEYESGIPKSYILETYPGLSENELFDLIIKEIKRTFYKADIHFDNSKEILIINDGKVELFVDPYLFYENSDIRFRFIPVFTFSQSQESDSAIKKLVNSSSFFDFQWLNVNKIADEYEAYRIEVSSEFSADLLDDEENFDIAFSSKSPSYLAKKTNELKQYGIPMNFVKGKFRIDDNNEDVVYLYIYNNGKVTFYGYDFDIVRDTIFNITSSYGNELIKIEKLQEWREMVFIEFSNQNIDPEKLEKTMKTILANDELKLMAFDIFKGKNYVKTIAADFHVGGNLVLDLYSYGLFITLLNGSCANSIKRIENFLRKSFNPNIKIYIKEEEILDKLEELEIGTT